ncbi:MAG: carboxypeptidase-like regulatory domain-containing protein [Pirellulaceae bacterium]
MKINKHTGWIVSLLTFVTSVTPMRELVAADSVGGVERLVSSPSQPAINDIELLPGGILAGQVVDATGQPRAGQTIIALTPGREAISTRSDDQGRFRLGGLKAGLCHVACGTQTVACRCWSPHTAPPAATKELLLTAGDAVERGQRPFADLITGPVLIGLIIAAAVAIPIAVHNSKKAAS